MQWFWRSPTLSLWAYELFQFIREVFDVTEMEEHEGGPTLLRIEDSLLWIEAGDLPEGIAPWVGSVYVYVRDVDAEYKRALER